MLFNSQITMHESWPPIPTRLQRVVLKAAFKCLSLRPRSAMWQIPYSTKGVSWSWKKDPTLFSHAFNCSSVHSSHIFPLVYYFSFSLQSQWELALIPLELTLSHRCSCCLQCPLLREAISTLMVTKKGYWERKSWISTLVQAHMPESLVRFG